MSGTTNKMVFYRFLLFDKLQKTKLIFVALFFVGALSRWFFVGQIMYHWDSINFAFSINEFNVAIDQPHVPGYILYVYLIRGVDFFFNDPQFSIPLISMISSGLATGWLYLLGKDMFNDKLGLIAALFLASSPLFWFYGTIALPHSLDTFAVILSVWLLYKLIQGQTNYAIPAAICLGIAGGFRPQTQVFLAPLILFAGFKLKWQQRLISIAVLGLVDLAWFVPLLWLNGGPEEYFSVMSNFSDRFQTTTNVLKGAGWFGFTRNGVKLTIYTLYGWGMAIIPCIIAIPAMVYQRDFLKKQLYLAKRFWIAFLWITPSFLYYLFIHMGQQGLVFVYLPMLLLISALAFCYLPWPTKQIEAMSLMTLILLNIVIFTLLPAYPLGGTGPKLLNSDTIQQHDAYYLQRFDLIKQRFSPDHTFILATNWRFPQFYLPDYPWLSYRLIGKRELGAGGTAIEEDFTVSGADLALKPDPKGYYTVILFDDSILPFNHSPEYLETVPLENGQSLSYLRFTDNDQLFIGADYYQIIPANSER